MHEPKRTKARDRHRINLNTLLSSIPPEFRNSTLLNFIPQTQEERQALREARQFAQRFRGVDGSVQKIVGPDEERRTALAAGIGNALLEHGLTVLYRRLPDFLRAITPIYRGGHKFDPPEVTAYYTTADLLILDDVRSVLDDLSAFKNAVDVRVFCELICRRKDLGKTTLLISNMDEDELDYYTDQEALATEEEPVPTATCVSTGRDCIQ